MEKKPINDDRIGGVKKKYVTGCLVFIIVLLAFIAFTYLFGHWGE